FQAGDLNPLNPNNVRASWQIHGDWIQGAANYHHARAIWFRRRTWNGGNCSHCTTRIRLPLALRDGQGNILVVGEDCAQRLEQGLNPAQWAELKTLRKIKKAKNGRFCFTEEVPQWFWNLSERPAFASISKFRPHGSKREKWYLSIWGADV